MSTVPGMIFYVPTDTGMWFHAPTDTGMHPRGLNASGFTVEGPWQTRSIVSVEVVSWWMLDLARAAI